MSLGGGRVATVLAVASRKGGVGKTTTAVNLAHGLSRKLIRRVNKADLDQVPDPSQLYQFRNRHYYITGHVLLIDLDAQGHCALALGIDQSDADLGEVLLGRQRLETAVISADRTEDGFPRPNLWLLPASEKLERAVETLLSQSLGYLAGGYRDKEDWLLGILQRRLSLAARRFSYVILDCAPGLDIFTQAVYRFAGSAIVPVKPDFLSVSAAIGEMGESNPTHLDDLNVEVHTILPTFYSGRQRLDKEMVDRLSQMYGDKVARPIPRNQHLAEAPAYGQTIFEFDDTSVNQAAVAYRKLVERVHHGQEK